MKVDILAIAVHPDDIELSCSGTIAKQIALGKKVAILDLTRGELGTRGTPETRKQEASDAAAILGVSDRVILDLGDGFFRNTPEAQLEVIKYIRKYQPEIVLANAPYDRHPDHGRASQLVKEACFYSGLVKIETSLDGMAQDKWRPKRVFHYIQDVHLDADFVVDISDYIDIKVQSILAYKTQFYNPDSKEPQTPISSLSFLEAVKGKDRVDGRKIGVEFGEGFISDTAIRVKNLMELI